MKIPAKPQGGRRLSAVISLPQKGSLPGSPLLAAFTPATDRGEIHPPPGTLAG